MLGATRFVPAMPILRFLRLLPALLLPAFPLLAQTQITPIRHNLPASYSSLVSIVHGNGTLLAVASNSDTLASFNAGIRVATSTDGVTWTPRTVTTQTYNAVGRATFFKGQFVLLTQTPLGTSGSWTSPDGVNWTFTATAAGLVESWATDGNTLVAAGGNGLLLASTDGRTFTPRTASPASISYQSVAYGQGKWFLTTNGAGVVYTSTDGDAWAPTTAIPAASGGSVVYFNPAADSWLAYSQTAYFTSADGVTFTNRGRPSTTFNPIGSFRSFVAGGQFVAAVRSATAGPGLHASVSGPSWSRVATPGVEVLEASGVFAGWMGPEIAEVAHANGKYYLAGVRGFPAQIFLGSVDAVVAPPEPTPPLVLAQPVATSAVVGRSASFSVTASGAGNTFQWRKDNVALPGATTATYVIPAVTAASAGTYSVVVTNPVGSVTSAGATLSLVSAVNAGRLVNLSIRSQSGAGADVLIVGFGLGGAGTAGAKPLLVRGVGPALGAFGLQGVLADPELNLFQGSTPSGQNDDWDAATTAAFSAVGAFPFPAGSRDAAFYNAAFAPNSYSAQIAGKNGGTGIALAEIYDATPLAAFTATTPRLTNISARTQVGTGPNVLIAGFVVAGQIPVRVLIRAVGPSLSSFGLTGVLADPKLEVFRGDSRLAENDNWDASVGATFATVGAFSFPAGSRDAALVVSLTPGNYSAQVSGVANTSGLALIEVYELP
jgi:hypothetical protein